MADNDKVKISELVADTSLTGGENIPLLDTDGITKRTTVERIKNYVKGALAALPAASEVAVASDGVFIRKDGEMKPVGADVLADAILDFAFGKDAVSELAVEAEILVSQGGGVKTADINTLAQVVKDAIELEAMDIDALPDGDVPSASDNVALAQGEEGERATVKVSLGAVRDFIVESLPGEISESTAALAANDMVMAIDATSGETKKVKVSNAGLGGGDVKGPIANTDGKIPQWDGANSKLLKDGLSVVDEITSGASSTEIPTAAAVKNAIDTAGGSNIVKMTGTSTENNIPQWDATQKTLKNGLAVAQSTNTSESGNGQVPTVAKVNEVLGDYPKIPRNVQSSRLTVTTQEPDGVHLAGAYEVAETEIGIIDPLGTPSIPTSQAVRKEVNDKVAECIKRDQSSTPINGNIPLWNASANPPSLTGGVGLTFSVSSSSHDGHVPSAKAVYDVVKDKTIAPSQNTNGKIPQWDGQNSKTLKDGLSVTNSITTASDNSTVPTAKAVKDAIDNASGDIGDRIDDLETEVDGKMNGATNIGNVGDLLQYADDTGKNFSARAVVSTVTSGGTGIPTAGAVHNAVSSKIGASNTNVADGRLVAFLGTSGKEVQGSVDVSNTLPDGTPSANRVLTEAATFQAAEKVANEKLAKVVVDEGVRTNAMVEVIGVRYITDPNTGDQVPKYGRYVYKGNITEREIDILDSGNITMPYFLINDQGKTEYRGVNLVSHNLESLSLEKRFASVPSVNGLANWVKDHCGVFVAVNESHLLEHLDDDYRIAVPSSDANFLYFRNGNGASATWYMIQGTPVTFP